jgi:pimeloyl-ACP methyl ester carboxylesterase
VLRGECDYVSETALAGYRQLLPAARYLSIEGAGHLIHVVRPDLYSEEVRAFLNAEPPIAGPPGSR